MSSPFLMKGRAPSSPYNGQNRRTFQGRGCKDPMPLFLLLCFLLLPPRVSANTIFKTQRTAPGACVHLAQCQSGVSCSPECCSGQDSLKSAAKKKKKNEPHLQDGNMTDSYVSCLFQEALRAGGGLCPGFGHPGSQTERPQAPPPEVLTDDTSHLFCSVGQSQSHDYAWCTRRGSIMPSRSHGKMQEHPEGSPNGQWDAHLNVPGGIRSLTGSTRQGRTSKPLCPDHRSPMPSQH